MRFVGADRIAAVESLAAAFNTAVVQEGPRLVSIEAPERGRGCVATATATAEAFELSGSSLAQTVLAFRFAGDPPAPAPVLPDAVLETVRERGREWLMGLPEQVAEECYARVTRYVRQAFPDRAVPDADKLAFTIVGTGSAVARVSVHVLGDHRSVVTVLSPVVFDVEPSDELARYLVEENLNVLFGAFSLGEDSVYFGHSILGDSLDVDELIGSVGAVLSSADHYDDIIVERFGGRTALADA